MSAGTASIATVFTLTPGFASEATTASSGSTSVAPDASSVRATSSWSSSTSERPISRPLAFKKVQAMAPPMQRRSTRRIRLRRTPILVEIFEPPMMATSGWGGSVMIRASVLISRSIRSPATAGRYCAIPTVEAWARCAVPKASLTYSSPSAASCLAKSGSFFVSPGWKRTFSSRTISPSRIAFTAASTAGPTQSSRWRTGRPISSLRRCARGVVR